ncbi:tyrosine-type recombinase/integrase [Anaeromyxobacter soli]|uniref:tyrosine-type recombinase/integrase n=1 Tax=Anaeromyxobacter soli TaxID=2922725 RepID=UPI001FAFCED1|nr:tyrosine-type recombinase/integrase [Anaeromyxobacter sp. SG29]
MSIVWRKRLQVRGGIDRWINFVDEAPADDAQLKARGVPFPAKSKAEAVRVFRDLHNAAREAVTRGEVAQFLDALESRERSQRGPGLSFAAFAEEWFKTCVAPDKRESGVETDRSILDNHLVPFFGARQLRDIDARLIDQYKALKRQQEHQYGVGYGAHTINNHVSVLRRIFQKAVEYKHVPTNPITPSAWLKAETTPEESRAWWTPAEEAKAMALLRESWRARHPERYMPLLVQLVVGIRFGELRALEKQDLDLSAPGPWVRRSMARKAITTPKNRRARFHVIPRGVADELKVWMFKVEGQLLFPGPDGGPLANNSLNRWYRELSREAGVREITSHGARHTSGSSYAVLGASQKAIALMLGHADTKATERYTHMQVEATVPLVEHRWALLTGDGR